MTELPTAYFHDDSLWLPPEFLQRPPFGAGALGVLMTALTLKAEDPDGYVVDAHHLSQYAPDTPAEITPFIEELRSYGFVTESNRLAVPVVLGEPPRLRVVGE